MKKTCLVLENIRSAYNVGSIFRTADAVGISEIYLIGLTPAPTDRFGRERKDVSKVALGAEKSIAWKHFSGAKECLKDLKENGFQIISVEQDKKSVDYKKVKPRFPVAFVFGSETDGVSKEFLKNSDLIAEIPMKGKKESLNVSVSAGVILFEILS